MKITLCNPGGLPQMDDVVLQFFFALRRLGHAVEISRRPGRDGVTLLFGAQCVSADSMLPPGTIVYNLEQASSALFRGEYAELLRRAERVWDYSAANTARLFELHGIRAETVFPGYVPEMTRLRRDIPRDIDLLFYGAGNRHRETAIQALRERHLQVEVFSGYGRQRDFAIARSRLVLNIHFYRPAILEIARLGYLWANHVPVLSEREPDDEVPPGFENACLFVGGAHLADAAESLLARPKLLDDAAERGFEGYRRMDLGERLREIFGPASPAARAPLPETLNMGSGKDFIAEAVNVDIEPAWNPDLVLDMSRPLEMGVGHATTRFGTLAFRPGMFGRVLARDVLEHMADLKTAMTNILTLLRPGGTLELTVPYELSLGAWQDPTHCRAFNENSWRYYTDWAWYLGWKHWRFALVSQTFVPSELGQSLVNEGRPMQEILRIPRAIDAIQAVLRKVAATREEKREFVYRTHAFYRPGCGPWQV